MKNQEFNQWNSASRSLSENIICALESIEKNKYKFIIKHLPNSKHQNPLKEINGALNNPFNWKCISQFHRSEEEIKKAVENAKNETEKDLLLNWILVFGEPEAIKLYENERICSKGLFKGVGACSQVRKIDMINFLKENGEEERAKMWEAPNQFFNSGLWTPKNISMYEDAKGHSYAVYFAENTENLSTEQLNKILDDSVIEIIKNS